MIFAPFDDQDRYELRFHPDPPFNYVPTPGDDPRMVEDAMNTLRLWDYFQAHAADQVVNAGAIAQEFGWPRAAVLHYLSFLLGGGLVKCDRGPELVKAMRRIGPDIRAWLRERGINMPF